MELGLIGWPVAHSRSPEFFRPRLEALPEGGSYRLFPIENISGLPDFLALHPELDGFNVTVPHKESILPYLDEINDTARAIGAVNTVRIIHGEKGKWGDLRLEGFNTDGPAFLMSLLNFGPVPMKHAMVLGTGGAARAVAWAYKELELVPVVVTRNSGRIGEIAAAFPECEIITYSEITEDLMRDIWIVANATPAGMHPKVRDIPPFPMPMVTPRHICYDLVYNPPLTRFLTEAAGRGASVKNGLEMLWLQADLAWDIWTS